MNKKTLVFLGLNEINFDIAQMYVNENPHLFKNVQSLLRLDRIQTSSEKNYEELEPWIQWVSAHTGKEFHEHQIFRLGDIINKDERQIFEVVESMGYTVGAISPMNAENKLVRPAYFIPDPWTDTSPDRSFWSNALTSAISQAVNDNAQPHLSFKSKIILILGFFKFAKIKNYYLYIKLVFGSMRGSWRKAIFLDLLLNDLHLSLLRSTSPHFSTLFLNAGAHIQHHYFFNSSVLRGSLGIKNPKWYIDQNVDPLFEVLSLYDRIVGDYLKIANLEFLVATGLSQKPYDQVKFYYRLNDHAKFLKNIGISFKHVMPRMTRDFLIEFHSVADALAAHEKLSQVKTTKAQVPIFNQIENRGLSLFVTLTYPYEVTPDLSIKTQSGDIIALLPNVSFVAIKNGMHQDVGFAFFSKGLSAFMPNNNAHVKSLFQVISAFFLKGSQ